MLTEDELAGMRSTIVLSLSDTAIVQTAVEVSDGGGGVTTSWVNAGTYDFRIAPVASSGDGEGVEGGRVHPDTEYVGTFPSDASVTANSRVIHGGGTYPVTALRSPRSWELGRRVELKRLT